MSTQEKLNQMMQSAAKNEERVKEYIEKKQAEVIHRTIETYARAAFDAMDGLSGGDEAYRAELIEIYCNTVKAMERC